MTSEPLVPNDLSEKQLNWGYWFVTHKLMLRRILSAVLVVFSAATLGFSGYRLVLDIMDAQNRLNQLIELSKSQLNPAVTAAQAPKPLSSSSAQVIVTQGKYDLIGTVVNPNQYFAAHFTYRFTGGAFATSAAYEFILPGEQKFVAQLGVSSETRPSNASLEILSTSWQRIDRHKYPDWKSSAAEHLNLPITDIAYTPVIELARDKPPIGRTSFTIMNNTGYGYYGIRALVVMSRGSAVVAVNSTTFDALPPNESRSGEVTWYEDYGAVTSIKVFPEVDILNDTSYIRAQ
jgi:hypothetical protein